MTQPRSATFPQEGLKFLRALKRNNNREWFMAHKSTYEASVKQSMEILIHALAEDFRRFAPELVASPKTSMYRIYRDTRFSKDKTPYKTHVAAVFPTKGLDKHRGAGLYFHIAPDEVLIGGGVYMPLPEDLSEIRRHIAANLEDLIAIVEGRAFRKLFGELSGERLQRVPRGYPSDHPAGEYLKMRQFLAGRRLDSGIAISGRFYKTLLETFRGIMPLIRFLNEPILRAQRHQKRQESFLRG